MCVRKFIVLILLMSMTLSILGFNGTVSADINDVPGIESYEYYYIKNVGTGKYLDVYNATDANGTVVWTYPGNRTDAQIWKVVRNSNGTYKFITKCSTIGRVLDITGDRVDIWSDHNATYQQFTIERVNTTAKSMSGTYQIRYNNKYIACDSNGNVYQSELYQGNYSSWSFEKVSKGDADIYSNIVLLGWILFVPDYFDTRGADKVFKSTLSAKGYSPYVFTNHNAGDSYVYMKMDDIWTYVGMARVNIHGDPCAAIAFTSEENTSLGNIVASRALFNGPDVYALDEMMPNELAQARVILYLSSYTDEVIQYGSKKYGLVKNTYELGAHFVVGVTGLCNHLGATYWAKLFYERAAWSPDATIKECVEHADFSAYKAGDITTSFVGDYNARL